MLVSKFANEIEEQPQNLQRLIDKIPLIKGNLSKIRSKNPRIVFFGMGSSFYAAISPAYLFISHGIEANFFDASEILCYASDEWFRKFDIVVFITQSGETSEIKSLIDRIAGFKNLMKVVITAHPESYVAKKADIVIDTYSDEEKAIGATKTYVNSVIAAFIFVLSFTEEYEKEIDFIRQMPYEIMNSIKKANKNVEMILNIKTADDFDSSVISSTGFVLSSVYQSVLTINAIASTNMFPISIGMLEHHGPERLFFKKRGFIAFIPSSLNKQSFVRLYNAIISTCGFCWIISCGPKGLPLFDKLCFEDEIISDIPEYLQSLLFLPYMQILSYKITTMPEEMS
uniref:Glutamine--fructose-6-phosphate aminotransferase [isomerizing] n=1 Tax=Thermodesulfobium narugense TaxID=184064 RepID=A0A7C5KCC7_9BACT